MKEDSIKACLVDAGIARYWVFVVVRKKKAGAAITDACLSILNWKKNTEDCQKVVGVVVT